MAYQCAAAPGPEPLGQRAMKQKDLITVPAGHSARILLRDRTPLQRRCEGGGLACSRAGCWTMLGAACSGGALNYNKARKGGTDVGPSTRVAAGAGGWRARAQLPSVPSA